MLLPVITIPGLGEDALVILTSPVPPALTNDTAALPPDGRRDPDLQHVHWRDLDPAPVWQHWVIGAYVTVVWLAATVSNLLVVWACVRYRSLRTSSNLLVLNLAVGGLLMCFTDFPLFAAASFLQAWPFGKFVCQAYGVMTVTAGLVTINTLAIISVDRYRAVATRLLPHRPGPIRVSVAVAACVWLYSLSWGLAPVLGWGHFVLDGIGTTCTLDYFSRSPGNVSFVVAVTLGNFLLPLVLIVSSYSRIWFLVRSTRLSLNHPEVVVSMGTRRQQLGMRSDLKTAAIMLAIVVFFLVTWLPYFTVCLLGLFGDASWVTVLPSVVPSMVAKTSTLFNPIIYFLSHPKVRRKLSFSVKKIMPTSLRRLTLTSTSSASSCLNKGTLP